MKRTPVKVAASLKPRRTRRFYSIAASRSARFFPAVAGFVVGLMVSTVFVGQAVSAATFQGPTQVAPGGNIPFTIWNRTASTAVQSNAAIAIDGGGPAPTSSVGVAVGLDAAFNSPLNLGSAAGGDNVYYGVAQYGGMNAADSLIKLETYDTGTDAFTRRFNVDKDGRVKSFGCFGATYVGNSALSHGSLGAVGNYYTADARCATTFPATASPSQPAAHVCTIEEMMESISCSVAGDPVRTVVNGNWAWLNGGPPGHTSNGNDCNGWQNNTGAYLGRIWIQNQTTGGTGSMTTCDIPGGIRFACCR